MMITDLLWCAWSHRSFRGNYHLYHQKLEATVSYKLLVPIYKTARHHTIKDSRFQSPYGPLPLSNLQTEIIYFWQGKEIYKLLLHYQESSNMISSLFTHFVSSAKVPIWTSKLFHGHVIYMDTHSSPQIKTGCGKSTVSLLNIWPYNLLIVTMKAGIIANYHCFNTNGKFLPHGVRPIHRINILWPLL